ncbi:acyl-CoA N-acyltransferase [Aaosphaeria arxii CBS 175.79]|uniref:Acyl-CoA N-acyltransferase n=1 Tax=Aaosphaeria arxii CBS 175.79 TaxID=1450172 RepID=A0A6A5Y136_9PLEO|nr:acyl-CoA N-acyltransferase [Aaosphaeria arxii CBS 175.79]KAF2018274.1 acyl-CoA N-acyltransferase [Aaosphaeria arxii CBS 175.79]
MTVTVRAVKKEDEEKWRHYWDLYNQFYERTIPEETTAITWSRFLDDKVDLFCAVAEDDASNEVIGFVTWFPHLSTSKPKGVVYLNDLFVDPDVRSAGTGGKLIEHVYEHSKSELDTASVYWHTQHFNHRAQLLYVKKGTKTDFVQYSKNL